VTYAAQANYHHAYDKENPDGLVSLRPDYFPNISKR
jgi:hypothetical protein